ncbi:MAG: CocE/NonD family hydrolase, partial [Chloroflexi bacterium]|nr:CocE/NonD family hydrolase [Chloroflexota bacterium]
MRDGTVLRADVYRPDASGKFPVLLQRTPYSKGREAHVEQGHRFAERGYVVVQQDVRGRYASDGELLLGFYSADHRDSEDGYDTVEWAAALPWSTGKVGTFGGSYNGWTQWELAHARPPHLAAMIPSAIAANLLDREMSGVLRLGRVLWWSVNTLAPDARRRLGDGPGP